MEDTNYEPLIQKSLRRLSKTVEQTQDAENGFKELSQRVHQEIRKILVLPHKKPQKTDTPNTH